MTKRSRRGCWTCKRRHKKCDEQQPHCQRCSKAGFNCEGYDVRLTWGSSGTSSIRPNASIIVNPERSTRRLQTNRGRSNRTDVSGNLVPEDVADETSPVLSCGSGQTADELNFWDLQFRPDWKSAEVAHDLPSEDIAQNLMESFKTKGYQTLTGRSGQQTLLQTDLLPLCETCLPLRYACLAYQSSLSTDTSQWTPNYMQSALSLYLEDIKVPEKVGLDVTLATGLLLCGISINCVYVWTPLLGGLQGVLQSRGLLPSTRNGPVACYLLEVAALLDIPCFTINRVTAPLNLWKNYIAPAAIYGVEQTSGLPYSLITIMASLGSVESEQMLMQWPGHLGDDYVQIHLWEAFRFAAILHSRALRCRPHAQQNESLSPPPSQTTNSSVARMRVFAAIQAIIDSGAFTFRLPSARGILYPLFIAGLLTELPHERKATLIGFQHLIIPGQDSFEKTILSLVVKVWEDSHAVDDASKLSAIASLAAELGGEIHLY